MAIKVFLADDHTIVRDGLRLLLEARDDIIVVGEASDGRQAVRQVKRVKPDVAVIDIAMPELNGIEATQQIRETCPSTKVIILSMHATAEHIFRAMKAGAKGYLLKESAGQELVDAVYAVNAGRRYLSRRVAEIVADAVSKQQEFYSPLEGLSSRERQILQLVVEGKTSAAIAECLNLSSKTVETYRSRLMRKLGIKDLPTLVKFAIQYGLIPLR